MYNSNLPHVHSLVGKVEDVAAYILRVLFLPVQTFCPTK